MAQNLQKKKRWYQIMVKKKSSGAVYISVNVFAFPPLRARFPWDALPLLARPPVCLEVEEAPVAAVAIRHRAEVMPLLGRLALR